MDEKPAIVPCPVCGQDKWRYLGGDLLYEPMCFRCFAQIEPAPPTPEESL